MIRVLARRRLPCLLMITACGRDPEVAAGERVRDAVCACQDWACVDRLEVDDAYRTYLASFRSKESAGDVPERMTALITQIRDCQFAATDRSYREKVRERIAIMAELRDRMCACKDAGCSHEVDRQRGAAMSAKSREDAALANGPLGTHQPTDDDTKLDDLYKTYQACQSRLLR